MNHSRRRIHEELRMVETQLPLYYQKVNELEQRQKDLQANLEGEVDPPDMNQNLENEYVQTYSFSEPTMEAPSSFQINEPTMAIAAAATPKAQTLGSVVKTNTVNVLEETRGKFNLLHEGINLAISYIDTIIMFLNLMEQSGGDLHQHLVKSASNIQEQVRSSATDTANTTAESSNASSNSGGISTDALMEIIKSPYFQQLASQLKANQPQ